MFDAVRRATKSSSELVPYWVYDGPVKVERRVPMLLYEPRKHTTALAYTDDVRMKNGRPTRVSRPSTGG